MWTLTDGDILGRRLMPLLQIPYPLISLVSRMPMTLHGRCPLTIHTRTFETSFLLFQTEKDAVDVFESVKELTVASKFLLYLSELVICVLVFPTSIPVDGSCLQMKLSPPSMFPQAVLGADLLKDYINASNGKSVNGLSYLGGSSLRRTIIRAFSSSSYRYGRAWCTVTDDSFS